MPTNKFIGDDEETDNLVIIRKPDGDDAGKGEEEESPDEASVEDDENEFMKWSDGMDAADEEKKRQDSIVIIASHGVDITRGDEADDPPIMARSRVYLDAYTQAKIDAGEWTRHDSIVEEDGQWCVYSQDGKKLGEYNTEEEAKGRLAQIEQLKAKATREK